MSSVGNTQKLFGVAEEAKAKFVEQGWSLNRAAGRRRMLAVFCELVW